MSAETSLPTDPQVLQQLVCELREQLSKALREKASLEFEVQRLVRQLFGRRSEKVDPNQLTLPELSALFEALARQTPAVEKPAVQMENGNSIVVREKRV